MKWDAAYEWRSGVDDFGCCANFVYCDCEPMETSALKLPSAQAASEARTALRELNGLALRPSLHVQLRARAVRLEPQSVTVPKEAFELWRFSDKWLTAMR